MKLKRLLTCNVLLWIFSLSASAADHFVENFDTISSVYSNTVITLPSGIWTVNNVFSETAGASRGGTGKAARINDDTLGAHLTTPVLNTVGTVSFYYRELNSGGGTFKLQKSISGGAFEDIATQAFAGTNYTFFTIDVNDTSADIEIRILNDDQAGHLIIDDMTVTDFVAAGTNQPPVLAGIGDKGILENSLLEFGVSATDPSDGDPITLSVSNAPAGTVFAATNGAGTFTWALPTPDGVYTMIFYAVDKDGQDTETISVTVSELVLTVSTIWDFEDGWQDWTNYSRFSNRDWQRLNVNAAEGTTWKMEADGRNADEASDDWLISPELNLAGVLSPELSYWAERANRGPDMTVKVSTNYPGTGDPLAPGITWAQLPFSAPADRDVWTPYTNDLSAYIGVTNLRVAYHYTSSGTDWRDAERWSVDQVRFNALQSSSNEPPVLLHIGNRNVSISNLLSFSVNASDPVDGDPITLTASNLPSGAVFSSTGGSGSFSWTNASPVGVYTTSFHAVDKDGSDSEVITITVNDPFAPTNPPVLNPIGEKFIGESNSLQFAVTASDVDGDPLTLGVSNLPAGASFTATNGAGSFLWSNAAPAGTYDLVFFVSDNDGYEYEDVTINVLAASPTGTLYFQGFESTPQDNWSYAGNGSLQGLAAKTDALGWRIGGAESIDFASVDISGYTDLVVHISVASAGGIENADAFTVYTALDGGAFPGTPDITLQESNPTDTFFNASWDYTAENVADTQAGVPATYYGDGTGGYATVRIVIPDGSTSVAVRIKGANNNATEYYYLDDIKITSGSLGFSDPPILSAIGPQSAGEGQSILFDVTAGNLAGDPITLSVSNLPTGAVFVDNGGGTGHFAWASSGPMGTYTAAFFAADSDGLDSEEVVFTITAPDYSTSTLLRVMAANTTSGTSQSYEDPGIRIFQGLEPDIVGIQEFNYSGSLDEFVDTAFGTEYSYYIEGGNEQIPNGIISRYPILSSGEWEDTYVSNRDFAWAVIDIPGTQDLYVVSVHFLTSSSNDRENQATLLKSYIQSNWPSNALITVCGDLNTLNRGEPALTVLSEIVSDIRQPADQNGDKDTNASRASDYDYVLPNPALEAFHDDTVIGGLTFTDGIVFDSRLWATPPSPIISSDSGALNMQHMAVMKTFAVSAPAAPPTNANLFALSGPNGSITPGDVTIPFGGSQAYTITPDTGFVISDVLVDGLSIGATGSYTFVNVLSNHSIAATFEVEPSDPNGDQDADGLPDWFETQHAGDAVSMAAGVDEDSDGRDNLEEYIADTDPTNSFSYLGMVSLTSIDGGTAQLSWQGGVSSVQYIVYYAEPLGTGDNWQIVFTNTPPTPVTNLLIDYSLESALTGGWYRVEAVRP